jgi:cytochrome c-type biogenesis protein CcmH
MKMTNGKLQITNYKLQFVIALILGLGLLGVFALPALAQGPNTNSDDHVNRIAKELYCPVCPNTPLDVCSTQACTQWRGQIKEMLIAGKSEAQVRDYFVSQYGDRVLGAPPAEGFNWLAYILPVIGVIFGGSLAWFAIRGRLARGASESPEAMPVASEYADRIEQELKED